MRMESAGAGVDGVLTPMKRASPKYSPCRSPTSGNRVKFSTPGGSNPRWGMGGREIPYQSKNHQMMSVGLAYANNTIVPSKPRTLFVLPGSSTATHSSSGDRVATFRDWWFEDFAFPPL